MENPARCGLCRAILDRAALAAPIRDEYGAAMCARCQPAVARVRTLLRRRDAV